MIYCLSILWIKEGFESDANLYLHWKKATAFFIRARFKNFFIQAVLTEGFIDSIFLMNYLSSWSSVSILVKDFKTLSQAIVTTSVFESFVSILAFILFYRTFILFTRFAPFSESTSIFLRSSKKLYMTVCRAFYYIIGPMHWWNDVNTFLILLVMQYSYPPCFLIGFPSLIYIINATLADYILKIRFLFSYSTVSFIFLNFEYNTICLINFVMLILYLLALIYLSTITYLRFLKSDHRCCFKMVTSLTYESMQYLWSF